MPLFLVAMPLLLVVRPGAPSSVFADSVEAQKRVEAHTKCERDLRQVSVSNSANRAKAGA